MKNPELFHKTVGILVNAYLNDTLQHTNCYACAVGNLVAGNLGYSYAKCETTDYGLVWNLGTDRRYKPALTYFILISKTAQRVIPIKSCYDQVEATGYSITELALIEQSFEGAKDDFNNPDHDGYRGLMSVVDTLIEIHEGNDTEKSEAKSLFKKELAEVG